MRLLLILTLVCVAARATADKLLAEEKTFVDTREPNLGENQCTFDPAYWCKNLTTSVECHATKLCIQNIWIHKTLPPDQSSVCQTCQQMVKEARDQLLINKAQEEIKKVFEDSCKLLSIKEISKECFKVADECIPQLIDTLASQMGSQVVCSVAGLCNNERVHQLLQEQDADVAITKLKPSANAICDGCHTVVQIVDNKFRAATRDQVFASFLQVCSRMGSLSDACSNIIITYFNDIYSHLKNNLNPTDFCLMAGEYSAMFHNHANVVITPSSKTGIVQIDDDLPCDLCKQLVQHLQDILIANTTEAEFHQVLTGLCKQTNSFQTECLNIVNENYPMIYSFLVNELNGTVVCSMIEICPGPKFDQAISKLRNVEIFINKGESDECPLCWLILENSEELIKNEKTEGNIRQTLEKVCSDLHDNLKAECEDFVHTNTEEIIDGILADLTPQELSVYIKLSTSKKGEKVKPITEEFVSVYGEQVEINSIPDYNTHNGVQARSIVDSPTCPLCELVISQLKQELDNNATDDEIKSLVHSSCNYLPNSIKSDCDNFVNNYGDEIIQLLIESNSDPTEVCTELNVCPLQMKTYGLNNKRLPDIRKIRFE